MAFSHCYTIFPKKYKKYIKIFPGRQAFDAQNTNEKY